MLVINRADMISEQERGVWTSHFSQDNDNIVWTNGVTGNGIGQVLSCPRPFPAT